MNPTLKKILPRLGIFVIDVVIASTIVAALAIFHVITLPSALTVGFLKVYSIVTGSTIGTSFFGYLAATKTSIGAWLKKAILGEPENTVKVAPAQDEAASRQAPAPSIVFNVGTSVGSAATGSAEAEIARQEERITQLESNLQEARGLLSAAQLARANLQAERDQLSREKNSTAIRLYRYYLSGSQRQYQEMHAQFNTTLDGILRLPRMGRDTVMTQITSQFPTNYLTFEGAAKQLSKNTIHLTATFAETRKSLFQQEQDAKKMFLPSEEAAQQVTTNELLMRNQSWPEVIAKYFETISTFLAALIRATDKSDTKGDVIIREQCRLLETERVKMATTCSPDDDIMTTAAGAAFFSPVRRLQGWRMRSNSR